MLKNKTEPKNLSYVLGIEDQAQMLNYLVFMASVSGLFLVIQVKTWPAIVVNDTLKYAYIYILPSQLRNCDGYNIFLRSYISILKKFNYST